MKKLNIGMIGYGFMGRTHSNAFSQVNHFFDIPYQPVLKTVCARKRRAVGSGRLWRARSRSRNVAALLAHLANRRDVLYACTFSLYRIRSTARRFSVPANSSMRRLNCSLAFRFG